MLREPRQESRANPAGSICRCGGIGLLLLILGLITPAFSFEKSKREKSLPPPVTSQATPYIRSLEDPQRDAHQKPAQVVAALGLRPDEVMADIGAGSGYFSFRFSPQVRLVYAIDVAPEMIRYLNRRIREKGLDNVRTILCESTDPLLPDASVDRVFICNTWHHIGEPQRYLQRLIRILKPGGQVIVIDFFKKELPVGPPPEIKVAREDLIKQFAGEGFVLSKEHHFLAYQYFLIFQLEQPR